ncbi:MAG TPA: hypothetical protein VHW00_02515 [Thermoanaerobaculia bacterium]|nr:hypothetical protein [Thermoanaerobaculia bacterium]
MTISVFLSLFVLAAAASAQPAADDVAHRAIDVLAGPAWDEARYLAFTFNVEREGKIVASYAQRWDRFTGDYRVSGKSREGDDQLVIMNVNTKEGRAWKNGQEVPDPKELLAFGYRRFINDTYWLLMGFKTFDPGVTREYAGEKTENGQTYDVVKLSFKEVGLTPNDVYWMWVNRNTGLVEQWHMKLQGSKPEDEPSVVTFRDYRRFGGLLISTKREMKGGTMIRLDDISVTKTVPSGAFAP